MDRLARNLGPVKYSLFIALAALPLALAGPPVTAKAVSKQRPATAKRRPAPVKPTSAPAVPVPVPEVKLQLIPESAQVSDADYPYKAKRFGQEGLVLMAITVSAEGRISRCAIHRSSGVPELDQRSCEVATERFRFHPTLRAGQPVESLAILPMDWRLDDSAITHRPPVVSSDDRAGN